MKIIAEIGSVHDGSFGNACRLIDAASACGADTVKFQTHIAEAESLPDAPSPPYFKGEPRMDYFRRTAFTGDQWRALKKHCAAAGVTFLSSPFSLEAVDLLEDVGVDSYKVPSGEVTNVPLLQRIAGTRKPALLSSGMSDWAELDRAVDTLRGGGSLTVMQCTTTYPCPPERVGLNIIQEMRARYGLPVGFSDHTLGPAAAFAAASLGAEVVEKHFTFSRLMYGSDAANAMEPADFRAFTEGLHAIWAMQANPVDKDDLAPFREMKRIFEKSVVTAGPIAEGQVLEEKDLVFLKPGDGISAARYRTVVGRRASKSLPIHHKIREEDLT